MRVQKCLRDYSDHHKGSLTKYENCTSDQMFNFIHKGGKVLPKKDLKLRIIKEIQYEYDHFTSYHGITRATSA